MEVRIVAILQAKPEYIDAVSEAAHQAVEPSRAELGNLQYDLHSEPGKTGTFVFFERWASPEAVEKHNGTEHFKHLIGQLDGKLAHQEIKVLKQIA
ncbi:quinol monooxygenase YgiN [Gibbsiella quercinecans]|uniref:Antibiotic biosynthesis monooxygenase n=1 Tax=Gibbsiella quercinecans TaxID=929813 RepID=A0A250AVR2_9GAMM|nr:putative quinol monooxygenase [Gibbsiella quercinecans]ATA18063.1 antibiotic biosynthesis monooxygenase [Gibbsiella quercinecans]RLM06020.1 antibiotic biosynthesis monooxygenase [Gibbsiella quercinecans]RLM10292.1 antibiotic biosynthesis monooxygenase [Gibbsiella quercinecans]RLM12820.1 antibiotic biosynthesis monooxygenase [Gibbsiella quercinecans]TCT92389.1 quinol monooxygenase YgiN [Gibbsiella quercinecans]